MKQEKDKTVDLTKQKVATKKVEQPEKAKPEPTTQNKEFAVINYHNQQFKVKIGSKICLPLNKELKKDGIITFDQVLMKDEAVGTPYLTHWTVLGKCLEPEVKDKKIIVFKYKAKKNYRVKTGHRQRYSLIQITDFQKKDK